MQRFGILDMRYGGTTPELPVTKALTYGYRIYYRRDGADLVLLLAGGDKSC